MDLYKKILELDTVYEGEGQQPGGFQTSDPKEAIREVVRRMFPGVTAQIPISENLQLNLGPSNEISAGGQFDVGGGELSIGGGMRGDDKAFGIGFRKAFKKGGFEKMNLERRLNAYNELKKTYGKKIIEDAFKKDYGTSFEKIADKKEYKGRTVTNIIDGFKKKIKGVNRSSATSPIYNEKTGHIYKTSNRFGTFYSQTPGRNQYAPMRSLEEVQKAIDNAPPIEIDGKLFEQNKKDLRGDSEFSGKEVVTRKEQDKYGDKLKYKSSGKKRIVPATQAYYDRRARELAKSNPTILKKLSGKGGYQLSHLSLSELDSLKNLGYLPAEINLKQYFPFEKKIVEISQQIYETQNNKKLSTQEKRDKIAELQRKDRALRKQFPEFANTKARLNVVATVLDPSGLMIKEKLPDPSIAIAPTEAGTQLKGTAVGSEKGKMLSEIAKEDLNKKLSENLRKLGFKCRYASNSGGLGRCDNPLSYVHDIKKQEQLLKTQTANKSAQALKTAKKLNAVKTLFTSTLGPGALAFEAVAALPIAYMGYRGGKTPANILADSTFNLIGKSDQRVLLDKAIELGYDTSNIKNVQKFYKAQKAFEKISEQADEFRGPDDEFQFPQIYEKKQKDIIDATKKFLDSDTLEPIQEKVAAFEQLPLVEQAVAADQAKLAAERAEKAKLSLPNFNFSYGEFSNGGIAGLSGGDKSGPPPERGPDSQGLRSLMKRGINL